MTAIQPTDPMHAADARRVRDLVYGTFAAEGRAPSVAELARLTDTPAARVLTLLNALSKAHALVLNSDGDAVRMAHPFSAAPMAFVLAPLDGSDDRRWWGGCAWDSFGISAALDIDVRVDTSCPECSAGISIDTGPSLEPGREYAVRFPRPAAEWWDDVVQTCASIRMFCTTEHAERWTSRRAPATGRVVPARTVWALAQEWYGDRIAPGFEPHSREHNQALLTRHGLIGSFWRLP